MSAHLVRRRNRADCFILGLAAETVGSALRASSIWTCPLRIRPCAPATPGVATAARRACFPRTGLRIQVSSDQGRRRGLPLH